VVVASSTDAAPTLEDTVPRDHLGINIKDFVCGAFHIRIAAMRRIANVKRAVMVGRLKGVDEKERKMRKS
jgi:hypothetical protein